MSIQANSIQARTFISEAASQASILGPQMVVGSLIGATLNYCGLKVTGETPLNSAVFFAMLPAVRSATQHLFRKMAINESELKSDSKSVKATLLITNGMASLCTAPATALVYSLFAQALNAKEIKATDILSGQVECIHFTAWLIGLALMITQGAKTLQDALNNDEGKVPTKPTPETSMTLKGKPEELQKIKDIFSKIPLQELHKAIDLYNLQKVNTEASVSAQ